MAARRWRALVVDDEANIQKLVVAALRQQGFDCETASNGMDAECRIAETSFDVVVTDLKMPKQNGHALAVNLLDYEDRPAIVIHTGVLEPKLARDLLQRGVDDIVFKPVNMDFLAAKVSALVERRSAAEKLRNYSTPTQSKDTVASVAGDDGPISFSRLNRMLSGIANVLPISGAALDVYTMTRDGDREIPEIAAAIQRDPSLTADVLRLANSSLYRASGQPISRLEQAVLRIGQNRIGEMSLASAALSALSSDALCWLDVEVAWKRSMASGLALEMIIDDGEHQSHEDGLLLGAIMHPLGRAVLGMLFPKHYESMIRHCERSGASLREQERCVFPTSHTEVLAYLLDSWDVPREVHLPLKFSHDEFSSLVRLSEPTRTKAELVKTAISFSRLAVGKWQNWDLIQLPSHSLLTRLRIANAREIIHRTRANLEKLAEFSPSKATPVCKAPTLKPLVRVAYCSLSAPELDLVAELLPAAGIQPVPCSPTELGNMTQPMIINCMGMSATPFKQDRGSDKRIVIVDAENFSEFSRLGRVLPISTSFGRFRAALLKIVAQWASSTSNQVVTSSQ